VQLAGAADYWSTCSPVEASAAGRKSLNDPEVALKWGRRGDRFGRGKEPISGLDATYSKRLVSDVLRGRFFTRQAVCAIAITTGVFSGVILILENSAFVQSRSGLYASMQFTQEP
jgi:hypothetical protein